ncbi:hypothetical protein ACFWF7_36990 [Nocardia sp. NPDC060256]|uniref:hypothetical protein n=1 Tax=unclassified Nocardia TaxID=2637762 RepID=UPI00365491D0
MTAVGGLLIDTSPLRASREFRNAFAARHKVIPAALLTGTTAMMVSGPLVLLPALAENELGVGDTALGLLYAAPGAGAVLGSLTSGWIGRSHRPGRALLISLALMPIGVIVAGVVGQFFTPATALVVYGLATLILVAVTSLACASLLGKEKP